MRDLTLLLSKQTLFDVTDNKTVRKPTATLRDVQELIEKEQSEHLSPSKFGRDFSKHLFLSLTRRSNALGWLEIRSFLAIEGKLLFGEQELPTLFLMVITVALSFFLLYRVFFIDGVAVESILFNGTVILMLICLVSLIRIAITGYDFENLQKMQQRLLGEQKLWMRCNVAESIGVEVADVKIAFSSTMSKQLSQQTMTTTTKQKMKTNDNMNENEELKYDGNDDDDDEEDEDEDDNETK
eukprot:145824_1